MKKKWRERLWSVQRPLLREEQGNVLVVCLMLMVVFTMLGMSAVLASTIWVRMMGNSRAGAQAFYAAQAGLAHAKGILRKTNFNVALRGPDEKPGTSDDGTLKEATNVAFGSTTYSVQIIDNDDGDGDPLTDSDGKVLIRSTGKGLNNTQRQLEIEVKKIDFHIRGAVTIADEKARQDVRGNAFRISGCDTAPGGSPPISCIGSGVSGISSAATAPGANDLQCKGDECDNIKGDPTSCTGSLAPGPKGAPSTANVCLEPSSLSLTELQSLRNLLVSLATATYNGKTKIESGTLGTRENPQITYVSDKLTVEGSTSGAGILIVDGGLSIKGNFNFEGIILVGICPDCKGEIKATGNPTIYGAILEATSKEFKDSDNPDPDPDFDNPGNIDYVGKSRITVQKDVGIYYSKKAIDSASGLALTTLSWREIIF
ncbi:MAG: pilus assembly PilX N-terminal domain-containing protein [Candidatus Tectomicrobia bacterium]|nr:pilus assembly PilX N-terminal domain-containing protein [Candidatus Tectomicrobia bacterium]